MKTRSPFPPVAASIAAFATLLAAPMLRAQSGLSLIRIADTATPIPSASGNFASFGAPGRSGGVTGIFGTRVAPVIGTDLRGIYRLDLLGFARVADTTMSAPPAVSGSIFSEMRDVSTWYGDTAFWASYTGGDGVFLHSGGTLGRMADRNSLNPSAGNPAFISLGPYVSTSDGAVSFQGTSSVTGIYFTAGAGVSLVADTATAIPGGAGNFTSLGKPSLDAGVTAFHGFGSASQGGIYVHDGASLSRIADKTTTFPSGNGLFVDFGDPVQDAGRTLFYGSGTINQQAIVLASGGPLQLLVSKATPVPSGTANISSIGSACAISGNNVVFIARDSAGADSLCIFTGATGRSALIQRTSTGVTTPVTAIEIGPESLDGKVVVFRAGTVLYSAEVSSYARNVSGDWDTAANWSFNETPWSTASVLISGAAAFMVTGPTQPAAVRTLEVLGINSTPAAVNFQLQPGGAITAAEGATVRFNSTLSGNGALALGAAKVLTVFGFTVSERASIAPGNAGVGTLTFGTVGNANRVIFGNFSTLRADYNSAGQCDRIFVRGDLDLTSTSDSLALTPLSAATGSYVLAVYFGALTGAFDSITGLPAGYSVDYSIPGRILLRSSNPDSDGDGIPDVWELSFALDLTTLTATGDADHDGEPDAAEYITDTNPLDPAQKFRITHIDLTSAPATHQLTWTSRPACNYRIESVVTLGTPWQLRLDNIPPAGATTTRALPLPPDATQFYRVVAFRVP